jgi:triosephosphate isomerase
MRTPLIAGNWKMNNTVAEALELVECVKTRVLDIKKTEIAVAPPFTALYAVGSILKNSSIHLSSQNVFWEEKGAFTGEISPTMLSEIGCKYAIVGHSERRQYFGETDETVNKRIKAALAHGIVPIVCIGETLAERESGKAMEVINTQLTGALRGVDQQGLNNIVIAYEPVWAIGTGKTATPQMAEEVHRHIRVLLSDLYSAEISEQTRILYGGSMNAENASDLLSQPDIDGGLIGGASLKVGAFTAIIMAAENASL